MDFQILTSKKGTRVIKSTQLHRALDLNDGHYAQNVKRWLADVYQFSDGIRKPAGMADYARAKNRTDSLLKEYYFSLELARLVALTSRSKRKQAVANKLLQEEEAFPQQVQLNADDMLRLVEQTKAMSRITCQIAAEKRHLAAYTRRRGTAEFWNHYRSEMVGYKKEELVDRLQSQKVSVKSTYTLRDLLLRKDPFILIRVGLVDLLCCSRTSAFLRT